MLRPDQTNKAIAFLHAHLFLIFLVYVSILKLFVVISLIPKQPSDTQAPSAPGPDG